MRSQIVYDTSLLPPPPAIGGWTASLNLSIMYSESKQGMCESRFLSLGESKNGAAMQRKLQLKIYNAGASARVKRK